MTRLITEWISGIEQGIQAYNDELKQKLGMDLAGLAARTCGISDDVFREKIKKHTTAVIPDFSRRRSNRYVFRIRSGYSQSDRIRCFCHGTHRRCRNSGRDTKRR